MVVRAPFVLVEGDANVVVVVAAVVVVVVVVGAGGVDLPGCGRPPRAANSSGSHTRTGRWWGRLGGGAAGCVGARTCNTPACGRAQSPSVTIPLMTLGGRGGPPPPSPQ